MFKVWKQIGASHGLDSKTALYKKVPCIAAFVGKFKPVIFDTSPYSKIKVGA